MQEYIPPFTLTTDMLTLVASIMEKIGSMNSFDRLDCFPHLRKQNRIRSVFSSCAIEANSLSLDQVTDLILGKKVVGPEKDILEVKNAIAAYDLFDSFNPFSLSDLCKAQGILGKNVISDAGHFRKGNEGVTNEDGRVIFIAPPPDRVPELMEDLFRWTQANFKKVNPLILSCVFHNEFVFIHPFSDGNGRTARLWQTLLLTRWKPFFKWFPIENHLQDHQDDYYRAIRQSHKQGSANPFVHFMLSMLDQTLVDVMHSMKEQGFTSSLFVQKLLSVMPKEHFMTSNEILEKLGLKSKETLRKHYLGPAIEKGLIVLEFPEKPTSRNQRYRKA